jgi:tape measure domain-containing protein
MAMSLDTAIKFTAKLEGQGLDQLKRSLQGLTQQSNVSKRSLDNLYTATKALGSSSGNTIAGLQKTAVALRALRDQAEFGSRKFKLLSKDLESVEQRLKKFQNTAQKGGGLSRGGAALAGFAGGIAGSIAASALGSAQQAVTGVASVGLAAETAQARIRALSNEFGEYNQVQASVARIATTLRLSNTEAADSFASLYASLRPTGITVEELEKAFIGFSAAARNSGATAQETSNALIQLKQGLASGVLQGEELRSIREQAPLAAQAIAKELGVSIGELKNLGAEGKVTTDVVLRALGKLQDTQLGKLNQQFNTGQQAIKDFQVASEELGKTLSRIFGPTAIALLRNFTGVLRDATDILGSITGDGDAGRRAQLRVEAQQKAARETDQRFGAFSFDLGGKNQFFLKRQQEIYQELLAADQKRDQQQALTADQREAREAAAAEREAARQRARKEALEDELKIRKDAEDKLADAAQRNAEQLADFQRETAKRAAALERDLGDERLKIERQIADTRTKLQAVLEDRALEAERQRLAAAGLSTEGIDTAREVKEIFRRYDQQRIENDRNAVDAQTDLQRRLEEYKLSVAEGIGKIQEAYARTVSNILQDAGEKLAEKMRQGAQDAADTLGGAGGGATGALGGGFVTSGNLSSQGKALVAAANKLGVSPLDLATIIGFETGGTYNPSKFGGAGGNYMGLIQFGPNERRQYGAYKGQSFEEQVQGPVVRYFQDRFAGVGMSTKGADLLTLYRTVLGGNPKASLTARDAFGTSPQSGVAMMAPHRREAQRRFFSGATITAAPAAPTLPGVAGAGSMPAGVQQAGARLDAALNESKRQQQLLNEQQTLAALEQKYGAITDALSSQQKAAGDKLRDEVRYFELIKQGVTPELAKQRVELEALAAIEQTKLLAMEEELQAKIATLPVESALRQELEKQVKAIEDRLNLQGLLVDKTLELADAERKAREEREKTEQRAAEIKELYASIKGTIAQGIIGGIEATIEAAMTGAEDLEDQLKQIASGVLKQIGSALLRFGLNSLFPGFGFADGGVMTSSGPAPLKRYSQGGIANRPQLALYGEGSKPEAYVPLPDGRRIPVALQGQDKMREVMGAGPAQGATSPVLNMSFQTTNIGGVEYVSRDQLEAAMAETRRAASRDGAKRGMTMTLDKLQQSPSTRTRVGLR